MKLLSKIGREDFGDPLEATKTAAAAALLYYHFCCYCKEVLTTEL